MLRGRAAQRSAFLPFALWAALTLARQLFRLCDPSIAHDTALEAFEVLIDPSDFFIRPSRDLVEMVKAQAVAQLFELGADTLDPLQIIGAVIACRG